MYQLLRNKIDAHTFEVIHKSLPTVLVKLAGMVIGLLVSIYLGRVLGADGLGVVNLVNRFVSITLIITMFGFDNVIVKNVAVARLKSDSKDNISSVIYSSLIFNSGLAILVTIIGITFASSLAYDLFRDENLYYPLIIAFSVLLPQTLSRVFSAGLLGYKKIWQSNLVNEALSFAVVGILLILAPVFNFSLNVLTVSIMYACGRIIVMLVTGSIFRYTHGVIKRGLIQVTYMLNMAKPLLLASATHVVAINVDTIMLGWLGDSYQVGIYTVSSRVAILSSFVLQVTNSALSPKIAALFADKKGEEMGLMIRQVTKGLFWFGILVLIVNVVLGQFLLSFWGKEFVEGYIVLVILTLGQFVNLSTGAVGLTLIMTGHEKIQGRLSLFFMCLNVLLNLIFIHFFHMVGAAIATTITVVLENLTKYYFVKKLVGVNTFSII